MHTDIFPWQSHNIGLLYVTVWNIRSMTVSVRQQYHAVSNALLAFLAIFVISKER